MSSLRDDPVVRRAGTHALAALPPLFLTVMLVLAVLSDTLAVDTASTYLPAARDLLHGRTPYHIAELPRGALFVSPPVGAFVFAPLLLLPTGVATWTASFAMLACVLGGMWAVGLRDWRCSAVVCLWLPTLFEFQTANVSALLALVVALVWRYRDRWVVAALTAGMLVALKLYGWPLVLFLAASRRLRAAGGAVIVAAAATIMPWALVGFRGLGDYEHLLRVLAHVEARESYALANLFAPLMTWRAAQACAVAVGLALLVSSIRAYGDRRKFILCTAAMLALSPIVWMHYFVVIGVVLAIAIPRLSLPWLLPLALWLGPTANARPHGNAANVLATWQVALVCATVAAVLYRSYRGRELTIGG